jgi:Trk K+ transport system NAD-binding subunit
MIEIRIPGDSPAIGKQLVELPLSQQTLIVLITRGSESYIPRGKTTIEKDDRLLVTVPESERKEVESIFLAAPR